jgi:hypothetical protein
MKKRAMKLTLAKETVRSLEKVGLGEVVGAPGSISDCTSCDWANPCPDEFIPLTWVAYSCGC